MGEKITWEEAAEGIDLGQNLTLGLGDYEIECKVVGKRLKDESGCDGQPKADVQVKMKDVILSVAKEYEKQFWVLLFLVLTGFLSLSLAVVVHTHITPVGILVEVEAVTGEDFEKELYRPGMYLSLAVQASAWIACLHELVFEQ